MLILSEMHQDVLLLTFNHPKPQNPFNAAMQTELAKQLMEADKNESVKAVVLYGGKNRSFSAGGDFKEIMEELNSKEIIAAYLNNIVDFYIHILSFSKPLVAAVNNYAIGVGFQVALCTDYRIGTNDTKYLMPELKNGVACTLGGLMTEFIFGRFVMQEICYECKTLSAEQSLQYKLLNTISTNEDIIEKAIEKATYYGNFPHIAFRGTKQVNNKRFIHELNKVRQDTANVHCEVILNQEHKKYMESILGRNQ
jgi:carboxymethylproline synthase